MSGTGQETLLAPSPFLSAIAAPAPRPWEEALDVAQALSPMASASYGRNILKGTQSQLTAADWPEGDDPDSNGWAPVWREARTLCRLAVPLSICNMTGYLIGLTTLSVAGRLGQFELSTIILGTSVFNVTGLSVLIGFSSAMETLSGQAMGAGNHRMVGVVFQRAIILTTCVCVLVALLQDPALSQAAARYIQMATPALWFAGMFEVFKRYLMAQGVVNPSTAATVAGLAMAPVYSYLFIFWLGLGLDGAAIAVGATQASMAALLGAYILLRDAQLRGRELATWHGWSREALSGWSKYLSVIMVCVEWWTFEALIIMSGWLPDPDLTVAVMGICINSSGVVWMVVSGGSQALSTRVGNALGAGCAGIAKRATWTAAGMGLAVEFVAMALVLLLRNHWAVLFTSAPRVIELTARLLPIFALTLPGDGCNIILQGLLRGSGRQGTGAATNLLSYWCMAIPLAAYLAFKKDLGLAGLWWAIAVTNTWQGGVMAVIALRFDYSKEAAKAALRASARQASQDSGNGNCGSQPLLEQGLLAPAAAAGRHLAAGAQPGSDRGRVQQGPGPG
ncbi:Protein DETOXIFICATION 1 [Chlorella vulgaris]